MIPSAAFSASSTTASASAGLPVIDRLANNGVLQSMPPFHPHAHPFQHQHHQQQQQQQAPAMNPSTAYQQLLFTQAAAQAQQHSTLSSPSQSPPSSSSSLSSPAAPYAQLLQAGTPAEYSPTLYSQLMQNPAQLNPINIAQLAQYIQQQQLQQLQQQQQQQQQSQLHQHQQSPLPIQKPVATGFSPLTVSPQQHQQAMFNPYQFLASQAANGAQFAQFNLAQQQQQQAQSLQAPSVSPAPEHHSSQQSLISTAHQNLMLNPQQQASQLTEEIALYNAALQQQQQQAAVTAGFSPPANPHGQSHYRSPSPQPSSFSSQSMFNLSPQAQGANPQHQQQLSATAYQTLAPYLSQPFPSQLSPFLASSFSSPSTSTLSSTRWHCPSGCGKVLNKRSFRSLKKHKQICVLYLTWLKKQGQSQNDHTLVDPAIASGAAGGSENKVAALGESKSSLKPESEPVKQADSPSSTSSKASHDSPSESEPPEKRQRIDALSNSDSSTDPAAPTSLSSELESESAPPGSLESSESTAPTDGASGVELDPEDAEALDDVSPSSPFSATSDELDLTLTTKSSAVTLPVPRPTESAATSPSSVAHSITTTPSQPLSSESSPAPSLATRAPSVPSLPS